MITKKIATIKSDFHDKFGVPRQSGMCNNISLVIFEKDYSVNEAFRGIEEYSHLWLIWEFHLEKQSSVFSPTVRPPKLGGNKRVGVFATRSPNRPNPIGLSLVKLLGVEIFDGKIALKVSGADLVDGTPVLDVKPYLPFADYAESASGSFTESTSKVRLYVDFPQNLLEKVEQSKREVLIEVLSLDPRPGYSKDPEKVFGIAFSGYNVRFKVDGNKLTVTEIE